MEITQNALFTIAFSTLEIGILFIAWAYHSVTPIRRSLLYKRLHDMTDLQLNSVLRKTEAGEMAIKVRDATLAPKSRMMLIMVDGKKPVAELQKLRPDPQEVLQILGELVNLGYASVTNPMAAPAPAMTASTPPVAARGAESAPVASMPLNLISDATALKLAIRRATRFLENTLGPQSEGICIQLEKCANGSDFTAKVLDIRRVVASVKSEKKADEFVTVAMVG